MIHDDVLISNSDAFFSNTCATCHDPEHGFGDAKKVVESIVKAIE